MKVAGGIAEYDPFHRGHAYHLAQTRRATGADFVVIALAGDFVQRGGPAMFGQSLRSRMALSCGADLVISLPYPFSCASARDYASRAVAQFAAMECMDFLSFGCEIPAAYPSDKTGGTESEACRSGVSAETEAEAYRSAERDDIEDPSGSQVSADVSHRRPDSRLLSDLRRAAHILTAEPEAFRAALKAGLRQGLTFPAAQQEALLAADPGLASLNLSSPNLILGLEYLKALEASGAGIEPVLIPRVGAGHDQAAAPAGPETCGTAEAVYSETIACGPPEAPSSATEASDPSGFLSASAIRAMLREDRSISDAAAAAVPEAVLPLLEDALCRKYSVSPDDLLLPLLLRLSGLSREDLEGVFDLPPALAARIAKSDKTAGSFSAYAQSLKTRDITEARVRRALVHALLETSENDMALYKDPSALYVRVLGFRKSAAPLLARLKETCTVPLITSPAQALSAQGEEALPPAAAALLRAELAAAERYRTLQLVRAGGGASDDLKPWLRRPLVILDA